MFAVLTAEFCSYGISVHNHRCFLVAVVVCLSVFVQAHAVCVSFFVPALAIYLKIYFCYTLFGVVSADDGLVSYPVSGTGHSSAVHVS